MFNPEFLIEDILKDLDEQASNNDFSIGVESSVISLVAELLDKAVIYPFVSEYYEAFGLPEEDELGLIPQFVEDGVFAVEFNNEDDLKKQVLLISSASEPLAKQILKMLGHSASIKSINKLVFQFAKANANSWLLNPCLLVEEDDGEVKIIEVLPTTLNKMEMSNKNFNKESEVGFLLDSLFGLLKDVMSILKNPSVSFSYRPRKRRRKKGDNIVEKSVLFKVPSIFTRKPRPANLNMDKVVKKKYILDEREKRQRLTWWLNDYTKK